MQILVFSYRTADLLAGTPYAHNQVIEGTEADAVRIAGEIFVKGLNVMLSRRGDGSIVVAVDNYRFQQR